MRILIADCSVLYTGRGDTKLKPARRVIMLKSDGAIAIHHDKGTKPLNYMGGGAQFTETVNPDGSLTWVIENRKEALTIQITSIYADNDIDVDVDNSELERDGTEKHLQEWIEQNPQSLGLGWTVEAREFVTGAGPVDILARDPQGKPVAVEVKRTAMIGAVDQAVRYREALKLVPGFEEVRGMVVALDVRPNTIKQADKRGISYLTIQGYKFSK
jgi:RecB family endonuclease NucS